MSKPKLDLEYNLKPHPVIFMIICIIFVMIPIFFFYARFIEPTLYKRRKDLLEYIEKYGLPEPEHNWNRWYKFIIDDYEITYIPDNDEHYVFTKGFAGDIRMCSFTGDFFDKRNYNRINKFLEQKVRECK